MPSRLDWKAVLLSTTLLLFAMSPALGDQFDHTHQGFNRFLSHVVVVSSDGTSNRVDYSVASEEKALLDDYLSVLASVSKEEFLRFGKANQKAFLINAYNAAMIQKILQRYPDINSVWDFGRIFNHPFKDRFVELFGERMSLDDIEHGRLRGDPALFDPRVHFAVNCASKGCPPLRPAAFNGSSLDAALDEQASIFLSDRTKNGMNPTTNRLVLSPIFDWYTEDFGVPGRQGELAYLSRYADSLGLDDDAVRALNEGSIKIEWSDYDWALNDSASLEQSAP
ncbi:MAG: DUF547 domain-containing protein [Gammaproteobacteria bacterium]